MSTVSRQPAVLRRWLPLIAVAMVAFVALTLGSRTAKPDAAERTDAIASRVKCPTCQGLSVKQSRTGLSVAIHDEIRRQVDLGKSDAEVLGYISDRYGDGMLINPPATGAASLVWTAPVVFLVVAFAGLGVALRRWNSTLASSVRGPSGADEREFLIRSLDDLAVEHAAGDLTDEHLTELRGSYEARLADVQRRIEGDAQQAARDKAAVASQARAKRQRVVFLAAAVAFAVGSGLVVRGSLGERKAGQTITGNAAEDPRAQKISELMTRAQELSQTDPVGSLEAYDQVTKLNPDVVAAWAYGGWQLRIYSLATEDASAKANLQAAARRRIDEAIRRDPTYPDAWAFRAVMAARDQGDEAAARTALQTLDTLDHNPMIDQLTAGLRSDLGLAPTTTIAA